MQSATALFNTMLVGRENPYTNRSIHQYISLYLLVECIDFPLLDVVILYTNGSIHRYLSLYLLAECIGLPVCVLT